jgi:diacylglycerol O-acyltransferase / wax synthase
MTHDASRPPEQIAAFDLLMHKGEANPRTRSGIVGVEILDSTPAWDRYLSTFEYASRRVLRLRQKIVVPTLPTAAPHWVVDPDFNLSFHVRRLRVPEPATLREVFDLAELSLQSPLDISRPLWTATLVEGLAGGRAAQLLHLSHAVTDGVGAVEMFTNLYDLDRDAAPKVVPPQPIPHSLSANELARAGITGFPGAVAAGLHTALSGAAGVVNQVARHPVSAVTEALDYARSGARILAPVAAPSPLLRGRSLSSRSEAIDIDLADLRAAGKAAGGSINDAYLAGLCGALQHYHAALGVPIATLPLAVPVNLRAQDDPAGGNRFTGVMLAAPVGAADPAARIRDIRAQMLQRRQESAIDIIGAIAPALSVLPTPIFESITSRIVGSDVQATNVAFYPGDTYLAGAKVLRQYGLGPLPGVAMMASLLSRAGQCTVTVRYDNASVTDQALFAESLQAGFDEVLAIAGPSAGRSTPASFGAGVTQGDAKRPTQPIRPRGENE